jgi:hypothetical protein
MRSETFSKQTLEYVKHNCNLLNTFKNSRMELKDASLTIKLLNDNLNYSEFGGFSNDFNVDLKIYESDNKDIFVISRRCYIISVNEWDYVDNKVGLGKSNNKDVLKVKLLEWLNNRKSYLSELNLTSLDGDDNYEILFSNLEVERWWSLFQKKYFLSGIIILAEKRECVNYVLKNTPIIIK